MAKDDLLAKGAILQRDEETYAITIRLPGGVIDIPTGRRIAETAKKYNAQLLKITGDARLGVIGIKEEDIDAFYGELGFKPQLGTAFCQQYIKACPGNTFCNRGQQDTLSFARKVNEMFYPYPKMTAKVKIGICRLLQLLRRTGNQGYRPDRSAQGMDLDGGRRRRQRAYDCPDHSTQFE